MSLGWFDDEPTEQDWIDALKPGMDEPDEDDDVEPDCAYCRGTGLSPTSISLAAGCRSCGGRG